ncbi:MAG: glycoside hydrolase family 3 C-terminal domain-containing protein [Candidatus Faecousia sp.]|nr:glycoside hydrolase family 3 C-terminal domain-containing protein [Clostridiales bacterium]MDY6181693.1 glycoside hydrolase family 3 C-terminal domain-containing protein [Candidatus Faecousia sp.]
MEEKPKYLDERLSFEERAEDLVSRMTLEECAAQLLHGAKGVKRLGVKDYNWWNEALHGVARAGMATVFPQAIGMAASFDEPLMRKVGDVISTEGRAKYNVSQRYGDYGIYKGLTFWSPNVNIFRDPRWGRGQETYGEDPYLTGRMGVSFVKGIQGDDTRYLKAAACAKHFAVHSGPEKLRHEFDARVSGQDMEETYLPAFHALVDAGVEGVMGAYNRVNGEPACGSKTLLKEILTERWGFRGYVTSDCWAVADFHQHHKVTSVPEESVKLALENGCVLNCGCTYERVLSAVEQGLLSEETVRHAAVVLMTTRMKLGMFDAHTPFDGLGMQDVDTDYSRSINERMARESLVLLKNNGILPLAKDKLRCISVIGPNADSVTALEGNYHGTANQYHTVLEAICTSLPECRVLYSKGCHLYAPDDPDCGDRMGEVKAMAELSDLVILVTGLDETIEGEEMPGQEMGGDKRDLLLPEPQRRLVDTLCQGNTPFIIVNLSGSAVDFAGGNEGASAIVQAWYPGAMGGKAIADLLFGEFSPSGRLPVTFYKNENTLPDFCDYSMKERTYKYFTGEPLFPFGYGLSYTRFAYSGLKADEKVEAGQEARASVTVENTGSMDSDTVVQFYLRDVEASVHTPKYRLCAFRHISLKAGERAEVSVEIPGEMFAIITEAGERVYEPGEFILCAGGSQPDAYSLSLTGENTISARIVLE